MTDDIINIIKVYNSSLDFSKLEKLIHSFKLSQKFNFVIYDLNKYRFVYFGSEKNKIYKNWRIENLNKGYLFLKQIFNPRDFANLVNEIVTLMLDADCSDKKMISSNNGGQTLRAKSKNGEWQAGRIHLIYLNENQGQIFKALLVFIEEDSAIQGIKITSREKEIFKLLSSGYSAKMVAHKLNISETTVITHRKNLIHKLDVKNSAELIKKGYELSLIN